MFRALARYSRTTGTRLVLFLYLRNRLVRNSSSLIIQLTVVQGKTGRCLFLFGRISRALRKVLEGFPSGVLHLVARFSVIFSCNSVSADLHRPHWKLSTRTRNFQLELEIFNLNSKFLTGTHIFNTLHLNTCFLVTTEMIRVRRIKNASEEHLIRGHKLRKRTLKKRTHRLQ